MSIADSMVAIIEARCKRDRNKEHELDVDKFQDKKTCNRCYLKMISFRNMSTFVSCS